MGRITSSFAALIPLIDQAALGMQRLNNLAIDALQSLDREVTATGSAILGVSRSGGSGASSGGGGGGGWAGTSGHRSGPPPTLRPTPFTPGGRQTPGNFGDPYSGWRQGGGFNIPGRLGGSSARGGSMTGPVSTQDSDVASAIDSLHNTVRRNGGLL